MILNCNMCVYLCIYIMHNKKKKNDNNINSNNDIIIMGPVRLGGQAEPRLDAPPAIAD